MPLRYTVYRHYKYEINSNLYLLHSFLLYNYNIILLCCQKPKLFIVSSTSSLAGRVQDCFRVVYRLPINGLGPLKGVQKSDQMGARPLTILGWSFLGYFVVRLKRFLPSRSIGKTPIFFIHHRVTLHRAEPKRSLVIAEMHHIQPLDRCFNYNHSELSDSTCTSGSRGQKAGGGLHDKQRSTSDLMMAQLEPFLMKPGELPGPESFL